MPRRHSSCSCSMENNKEEKKILENEDLRILEEVSPGIMTGVAKKQMHSSKYWERRSEKVIALSTQARGTYPVLDHSRGRGVYLYDLDGKKYLDITSGVAVRALGARHPELVEFEKRVVERVVSELPGQDFDAIPQTLLAEKLASIVPGKYRKNVFFTTSGGRAVETALKVAMDKTCRFKFAAFQPAFHGRTGYALALTCSNHVHKDGFPAGIQVIRSPYAYCYRCPYNLKEGSCGAFCVEQLRRSLETESTDIAGIVMEPICGEGGLIVPSPQFVKGLRKVADDYGALLIDDEVQAGLGRTGKWWAIEHFKTRPDLIATAKSLGGGYPLGATIGRAPMFTKGSRHSETFSAEPRMALISLKVLSMIEKGGLIGNSKRRGREMLARLKELVGKYDCCGDARGLGLMMGIEIVNDKKSKTPAPKLRDRIVANCIKSQGLWTLGAGPSSIRVLPPLNITKEEASLAMDKLEAGIKAVVKKK